MTSPRVLCNALVGILCLSFMLVPVIPVGFLAVVASVMPEVYGWRAILLTIVPGVIASGLYFAQLRVTLAPLSAEERTSQ